MSTIKSSAEDLTLNADGSGNDIKFQSNGSEVGSLTAEGVLTATSFAGSGAALTGLSSFDPDGAQVFNESGADVDFRIEANTSHAFFMDGTTGKINLGHNTNETPKGILNIDTGQKLNLGTSTETALIVGQTTGAPVTGALCQIGIGSGNNYRSVVISSIRTNASAYGTDDLIFALKSGTADVAPTERVRMLSGGGITFNGDTADANALDDYEEGTWTPAFSGATVNTGASNSGTYIKIGQFVHCTFAIEQSALTGGNTATMTGLPYSTSAATQASTFAVQDMGHTLNTVSTDNGRFRCVAGSASLQGVKSLGSTTYMNYDQLYDGSGELNIRGAFSYRST